MTKVVITGSKNSSNSDHILGKWLHEYFTDNFELIQLSRATGYDFYKNYDEMVKIAKSADIFVNSACIDDFQIKMLEDVYGHVPYMLVLGSVTGDFYEPFLNSKDWYDHHSDYIRVKHILKKRCQMLPLEQLSSNTKLLHLTITEVENFNDRRGITQQHLANVIEFWLLNPVISNIDFQFFTSEHFFSEYKMSKINTILNHYNATRIR